MKKREYVYYPVDHDFQARKSSGSEKRSRMRSADSFIRCDGRKTTTKHGIGTSDGFPHRTPRIAKWRTKSRRIDSPQSGLSNQAISTWPCRGWRAALVKTRQSTDFGRCAKTGNGCEESVRIRNRGKQHENPDQNGGRGARRAAESDCRSRPASGQGQEGGSRGRKSEKRREGENRRSESGGGMASRCERAESTRMIARNSKTRYKVDELRLSGSQSEKRAPVGGGYFGKKNKTQDQ